MFNFIASAQEVVHEDFPDTKLVLDKNYTAVLRKEVFENKNRIRSSRFYTKASTLVDAFIFLEPSTKHVEK